MTELLDVRMSGDLVLATIKGTDFIRTYPLDGARPEWADMWKNGEKEDRQLVVLWVGNELKMKLKRPWNPGDRWKLHDGGSSKYWKNLANESELLKYFE